MKLEEFNNYCGHLSITLREVLVPYLLKEDWNERYRDFDTFEALECMVDDVTRISALTDFYDELVSLLEPYLKFALSEDVDDLPYDLFDDEELEKIISNSTKTLNKRKKEETDKKINQIGWKCSR